MKNLVFLALMVCCLALVAKVYHYDAYVDVPRDAPAAVIVAAGFAGSVAGSMTDPVTIFMALTCLALGAIGRGFLLAAATSVAAWVLLVIFTYSYWAEIGLPMPEQVMKVLLTYLFICSIAFWIGFGVRAILKRYGTLAPGANQLA